MNKVVFYTGNHRLLPELDQEFDVVNVTSRGKMNREDKARIEIHDSRSESDIRRVLGMYLDVPQNTRLH